MMGIPLSFFIVHRMNIMTEKKDVFDVLKEEARLVFSIYRATMHDNLFIEEHRKKSQTKQSILDYYHV